MSDFLLNDEKESAIFLVRRLPWNLAGLDGRHQLMLIFQSVKNLDDHQLNIAENSMISER